MGRLQGARKGTPRRKTPPPSTSKSPRRAVQTPPRRQSSGQHTPHTRRQSGSTSSSNTSRNTSRRGAVKWPTRRHRNPREVPITRKQLKQMRQLQATYNLLLPRLPFARVVREITQEFGNFRYQGAAVLALQEAAESYLLHIIMSSQKLTSHAHRVTLMRDDMTLATDLHNP